MTAEKSLTKYLCKVVMFSLRIVIQRKLVIVERTPFNLIMKEICCLYRSNLCLNRCKGNLFYSDPQQVVKKVIRPDASLGSPCNPDLSISQHNYDVILTLGRSENMEG